MQLAWGHDGTHDGGVTVPHCRTLGWVPKARERGSGVQLKPVWERQQGGSIPICTSRVAVTPTASSPIARLTSHRLLLRLVAAAWCLAMHFAAMIAATHWPLGLSPAPQDSRMARMLPPHRHTKVSSTTGCSGSCRPAPAQRRMRKRGPCLLVRAAPGVSAVAGSRRTHAIHGHFPRNALPWVSAAVAIPPRLCPASSMPCWARCLERSASMLR
ncbi:hypothetical protein BKA63DRAFT_84620 [Paraphoma chrysanthemicola]|nr:hypothetical protein BKA63DRAFT_84620 [Paraphoma chrysanthemicola]